jgi:hypothetical protein
MNTEKKEQPPVLKYEISKDRVNVIKVYQYHGVNVYIMQFDDSLFAYFLAMDGEIFFNHIVMFPAKGKKKLTNAQLATTVAIVQAGANTTIETKLGIKPDESQIALAEVVIKSGDKVFKEKK